MEWGKLIWVRMGRFGVRWDDLGLARLGERVNSELVRVWMGGDRVGWDGMGWHVPLRVGMGWDGLG